jgi:hypothetical protein
MVKAVQLLTDIIVSLGCEAEMIDSSNGGIILIKDRVAHHYCILDSSLNVCLMDGRLNSVVEGSYCNLNDPNSLFKFEKAIKDMKRLQDETRDGQSRASRTEPAK